MAKSVVLIGLGPHARRIYYPLIEKFAVQYGLRVPLIIDLADQAATIRDYLATRALKPERVLFLDAADRTRDMLTPDVHETLAALQAEGRVDGVIIATEPKAHLMYAAWALEHHVDILMDKPISAPVGVGTSRGHSQQIMRDYEALARLLTRSNSNFIVQCQRRHHPGYLFIRDYLTGFMQEVGLPLSYIDIYHADGVWNMPDELYSRENHPYKYGYGKLMHSGYHFIDLFCWLNDLNMLLPHRTPDSGDLFVRQFGVNDFLTQIAPADYQHLMPDAPAAQYAPYYKPIPRMQANSMGELDVFISAQFRRAGAVTTTGTITLQQNSFSRRDSPLPPKDVYKGAGRVRHERVTLQVGPLLNIQVHSYQAYEVGRPDVATEGAGHRDHFEVYVFRNAGVVGGTPLEKHDFGMDVLWQHQHDPYFLGHNEQAREALFLDFLERRPSNSHFLTHRQTNALLTRVYECLALGRCGELPYLAYSMGS